MIEKEKQVNGLHLEIGTLKSRLNESHNGVLRMINELETKVENMVKENDVSPVKETKSERIEQFKDILEMARHTVHELAQPLTVLMGRCEFLEMLPEENPKVKKHIDSILVSAKRIESLINRIREINKTMAEYCDMDNNGDNNSLQGNLLEN
jgi:signal transduction histidine kinase